MFKQITSLVLLAAISLQLVNRTSLYLDYYLNMTAYIKNCENKARPMMHCNGRCQMMKKMREQEKKETDALGRKSIEDETVSSKSFFASVIFTPYFTRQQYNFFVEEQLANVPRSFFHPPGI